MYIVLVFHVNIILKMLHKFSNESTDTDIGIIQPSTAYTRRRYNDKVKNGCITEEQPNLTFVKN